MKKIVLSFCCLSLLVLQYYFPWWTLVFPCFLLGYYTSTTGYRSFFSGFCITFLVWFVAAFYFDGISDGKMGNKIASLFFIPGKYLLYLISSFIAGLVGGLASLSTFFVKELLIR